MTNNEMEQLVSLVLARLKKPVLVVLTAGTGYQQEIVDRLATLDLRFDLVMTEEAAAKHSRALWGRLGEYLPGSLQNIPVNLPWSAVVLPFMTYPLAAELVSGTLHSPVSQLVHHVLLSGIPTLALRYHCDPGSELNELRGFNNNPACLQQIQRTLMQLQKFGLTLCTLTELYGRLDASLSAISSPTFSPGGYITVSDLINNPALGNATTSRFTDAAVDYLKGSKR